MDRYDLNADDFPGVPKNFFQEEFPPVKGLRDGGAFRNPLEEASSPKTPLNPWPLTLPHNTLWKFFCLFQKLRTG
jgi:hypothetical protein